MWSGGNAPPPAAPVDDQVTLHEIVETTGNAPSFKSPSALGWPADELLYVYEQSVDCAPGGIAGWYGVPGPLQMTVCPSPMDQEIVSGTAVAVAVTPPAVAVALKACHDKGSIQSHELKFTTLNDDGLRLMTGEGKVSSSAAFNAKALGADGGVPTRAGELVGIHDSAPL